jgi:hypothetical protein
MCEAEFGYKEKTFLEEKWNGVTFRVRVHPTSSHRNALEEIEWTPASIWM